jgi:lysophosphatidate acyltransferase
VFRWRDLSLDHYYGQVLRFGVAPISGIPAQVEGIEHWHAHQPCIYVINHQSNMDSVVLSGLFPKRTILIGKKQLLWIPFFGLFYYGAGNILIDRKKRVSAIAGLDQAVAQMKARGASIFIFPEGTRNSPDKGGQPLLPFKKGAFYMAIQAGVPLVPIVSSYMGDQFDWKKRIYRPGPHRVRILPPIPTSGMDVDRLSQIARDRILETLKDFGDPRIPS